MRQLNALLGGLGDALRRHGRLIRGLQWAVVAFYGLLLVLPALYHWAHRKEEEHNLAAL